LTGVLFNYWTYSMYVYFNVFDLYPFTFWWLTQRPASDPANMPLHMQVAGSYELYFMEIDIQHSEKLSLYTASIADSIVGNAWTVAAPTYQS
jgi:hypothetical protein